MLLRFFVFLFVIASTSLHSYDFANIAKDILHKSKSERVRCDFAKELYAEIEKATDNFTKNLKFEELKQKNVTPSYLDYMATEIAASDKNTFLSVVWPVVLEQDKKINRIFNKYCNVICYKRVMMNEQSAKNFLAQIPSKATHPTGVQLWFEPPFRDYNPMRVYLIECKPTNVPLPKIRSYLTKIFSNSHTFIKQFEKKHGVRALQNLYTTTVCKREIRRAVRIDHALHVCDTNEETQEIANILFNENSINCLKHSNPAKVKTQPLFNKYIALLKKRLGKKIDQIIVYNGAVLSAFGLRDCNDIDFLHNPRISLPHNIHPFLSNQNRFFKRLYVILEDESRHYILEDIPHAYSDVNLDTCDFLKKKVSIDDLLYDPTLHFYFHGVKFATLEFMHYFKSRRGRAKDLRDVALIEESFLNRYD
ncbi:MAG: hypothetical protein ChlgKO_05460 [Chlamydiales bacterium]